MRPLVSDAGEDPGRPATPAPQAPAAPRHVAPACFFGHVLGMLVLHFGVPVLQWNLGASRWLGLPVAAAGFALVVVGAGRFHRVTTLRPYEEPSALVTDGLHRWSRNPMYLGLLVSLVGGWIMLGSLSPGLAIASLYWLLRTRFIAYEEYAMEARFGEAYRAYRERVRRWL